MFPIIVGIALIVAFGFAAIPKEIRGLIAANCRSPGGRVSLTCLLRESAVVLNFFAGAVLAASVVTTILLLVIVQVTDRVIPIDMIGSAVAQAELDPVATKNSLTNDPNNVSQQHERWYVAKGHTREEARRLQRTLIGSLPFAVPVIFGFMLLALQLGSKSHAGAIQRLLRDEVQRTQRRLQVSYLQSTTIDD